MKRNLQALSIGDMAALYIPRVKRRYHKQALSSGHMAVLDTIRGIIKCFKKKYCFPSQTTILEKLRAFHGITICDRTLNYWLARLEQYGLIYRIRRLTRESFRSTVYYLLDRGGHGVVKAKKIIGISKRLSSILPSRAQKFADNKHIANMLHSGGRPRKAAPAPLETNRCEASDRQEYDGKEPQDGGAVRKLMDLIRRKDKERLLKRGS